MSVHLVIALLKAARPKKLTTMKTPNDVWMLTAFAVLSASIAIGACSPVTLGATEANYARAQQLSEQGSAVYSTNCAACHGQRGAGTGNGPSVMGAGALPKYPRDASDSSQRFTDPQAIQTQVQSLPPGTPTREPFITAQDVYDYVSKHMPEDAKQLSPEENWAVITFLLAGHGVAVPDGGVNAGNASKVSVQP